MAKRLALSSTNPFEEACLHLANQLIRQSKISVPMVSSLKNIDSYFITLLFESICGNPIPDLLPFSDSINEVHNVQAVIDTLSLDLLGISLSHITGEDVVAGKVNAIFNLLEVFEGILLFISPEADEARGSLSSESVEETKRPYNIPERPKGLFANKLDLEEASNSSPTNLSIENLENTPSSQPFLSLPSEEATAADSPSKNVKQQLKSDFEGVGIRKTGSTDHQVHDDGLNAELQSRISLPQPSHILENTSAKPLDAIILKGGSKAQSLTKLPYTGKKTVGAVAGSYKSKELKRSNLLKGSQTAKLDDEKAGRSNEVTVAKTVRPPPKRIVRKRKALKSLSVDGEEILQNQRIQASSSSANEQTEPKRLSGSLPFSRFADETDQTDGKTENKSEVALPCRKIKRKKSCKPVSVDENKIPKNETVEDKYEENLENKIKVFLEQQKYKQGASKLKIAYKNAFRKPMHKKKIPLCNKSFLLPTNLRRHRTRSSIAPKRLHTSTSSSKHSARRKDENEPAQPVFIQNLHEDFPCVHFSPHTVRCMTERNENHLTTMHRQVKSFLLKKPKTKIQLEEASKRQEVLSSMLKNELQNSQRLNQLKQDKKSERKVGYSLRDARLRSVRTQRYFKDFHEDMKKRMQSRNIAEETLIKKVHDEALNIEKEQVRILCKRAKEMDQKDAEHNKRYLESLDNFYQIQYDMFSESLAVEKRNMEERAKAQKSVLQSMERDMREKLISEVTDVQQQVVDSQRDIHFRELDAQRYLEDKRDRYSAGIR